MLKRCNHLIILFLVMALTLTACGGSTASPQAVATTAPTQIAQVEVSAPPTAVSTQPQAAPTAVPKVPDYDDPTPVNAEPTLAPTQVPRPIRPTVAPSRPTTSPTATPTRAVFLPTINTPRPEPAPPVRFKVNTDRVKIDAAIEYVGLTEERAMDVPKAWENVAWYEPGYVPGQPGNAVIAGHLDSTTGPAVFIDLEQLKVGDMVSVVDKADKEIEFRVTRTEVFFDEDAPLLEIFGPTRESHLNLITCDGKFDRVTKRYDRKLVVFTERV